MSEPRITGTIVNIDGEAVVLNPELMKFNQSTLSNYYMKEGPLYAFFGQKLADAEKDLQALDTEYDILHASKYSYWKGEGVTDKQADANAKCDEDVADIKRQMVGKKHTVKLLQTFLRAWDRNHENAQSLGHMVRKEMEKLAMGTPDIEYESCTTSSNDDGSSSDVDKYFDSIGK